MNFADLLQASIKQSGSVLCAGLDPQPETFPKFLIQEAQAKSGNDEDFFCYLLQSFYEIAISALRGNAAAVKPNLAFFEQLGIGGLRAYAHAISIAKKAKLPVIADAKRGDIGSTAQAYSHAFLGGAAILNRKTESFEADAVTVSPFLGFETLEPFLRRCGEGKGIFVLVKTSNPGSKDLQDLRDTDGDRSVSEHIADFLASQAMRFKGACGYSALGAVVGATRPEEARALRRRMPTNFFLIPGYGAQGASATESVAAFSADGGAGIVNTSRALLGDFGPDVTNAEQLADAIKTRAQSLNAPLLASLAKRTVA